MGMNDRPKPKMSLSVPVNSMLVRLLIAVFVTLLSKKLTVCLATQNLAHSFTDVNERGFLSRLARFLTAVDVVVVVGAAVAVEQDEQYEG